MENKESIFSTLKINSPDQAFNNAIKKGMKEPGDWMYMSSDRFRDYFKNSMTRGYVSYFNWRNVFDGRDNMFDRVKNYYLKRHVVKQLNEYYGRYGMTLEDAKNRTYEELKKNLDTVVAKQQKTIDILMGQVEMKNEYIGSLEKAYDDIKEQNKELDNENFLLTTEKMKLTQVNEEVSMAHLRSEVMNEKLTAAVNKLMNVEIKKEVIHDVKGDLTVDGLGFVMKDITTDQDTNRNTKDKPKSIDDMIKDYINGNYVTKDTAPYTVRDVYCDLGHWNKPGYQNIASMVDTVSARHEAANSKNLDKGMEVTPVQGSSINLSME